MVTTAGVARWLYSITGGPTLAGNDASLAERPVRAAEPELGHPHDAADHDESPGGERRGERQQSEADGRHVPDSSGPPATSA